MKSVETVPAPVPEPAAPKPATRNEMVIAWLACEDDVARAECVKRFPELTGIMSGAQNFAPKN